MNLDFWKRFIHLMLPKSEFWSGVFDRPFTALTTAFATVAQDAHDYITHLFLDVMPSQTRKLSQWSEQFNFAQTQTRSKVAAELKQRGGQSPHYLQTSLQDAGFDVYVHEWFYPVGTAIESEYGDGGECGDGGEYGGTTETTSHVARNPFDYIRDTLPNNLLVNPVFLITGDYPSEYGDGGECGDGGEYSGSTGIVYQEKIYSHPFSAASARYYFYLSGEVFGDYASVPQSRRSELLRIIYKIKPIQQRCVLLINFTADFEDSVFISTPDSGSIYISTPDTGEEVVSVPSS